MWQFLQRLGPYLRDYTGRLTLSAVGGVLGAAAYAGVIYLVRPVMDGVFVDQDPDLHRTLPFILIGLFLVVGIGRYVQTYELQWVGEDIVRRLRDRLLRHMLQFDLGFFNAFRGGELISRITSDIMRVRIAVSQHLAVIARESLTAVGFAAVAVYQSPRLAFWGIVVLPLAAWPLSRLAKRFKRLSHRSQEKDSDITSRLAEIFNNMEIIKVHSSEDFEALRFERDNLEVRKINMKGVRTREMTNPLMEFLGAIAAALVIWIGGHEILEGRMTVGQFTSFAAAMFSLYNPIKRVSQVANQMFEAVAASERIFDMLGREPAIRSGVVRLEEPITSIELDDVHLSYGPVEALRGVSLTVGTGETVALVGDSGGGKSSLVNLIPRLFDPTRGVLRVNGVDARDLDICDLRSRIGMVTQRVYVFHDTVAHNVAYGEQIDEERVVDALRRAGAWEFVERMDDGIDTVLDEFGANLSGGQRQRLAIARAIYRRPDVLILDEATSALDNRSEALIQTALEEIVEGKIAFVIAHRLSTVDLADRIVVVAGGRIVGQGTKDELMRDCADYRRLVEAGLGRGPDAPAS